MPAQKQEDLVKQWMRRLEDSEKQKQKWSDEFEVKRCAAYYTGHQRTEPTDEAGERRMIINRILPSVRAAIPSLYFNYPYARVHASPARSDTPGSTIEDRAKLLEDTVNALIRDPRSQFQEQTYLAIKESFWAFGAVEVVYSAEFVDNPSAKNKPALKEDDDTPVEPQKPEQEPIADPMQSLGEEIPDQIIDQESFYVRRIPAKQILVSKLESAIVAEIPWVGYWEYLPLSDVKKATAYRNTSDLKPSAAQKNDDGTVDEQSETELVKLYKIWDQRTRTRYVLADGHDKFLLKEKYKRLPLFFLRFEVLPDRLYPIPPIYSALPAQDEYNDSREMLRELRKSIVPRYTYDKNAVLPEDLEKFESGDIGTYIPTDSTNPTPIQAVNQPSFSDNVIQTLTISSQEFTELMGVSGESRQIPQSDTATQASIIAQKENIQDTFDRQQVGKWLGAIAKEMLLQAIDFMVLPRWIRINSDPFSPGFMQDSQVIAELYKEITLEELLSADAQLTWDVSIDMDTLSPVSEQQRQASWNQTLAMLSNPGIAKVLAMSPDLLIQTLKLNGIKTAKEQESIGQALTQLAQMEMANAAAAANKGQGAGPVGVSPMPGQPPAQGGLNPGPRPTGPAGGM